MPLKVKILNGLATPPSIAHAGEDLGYDVYALRVNGQAINVDGTPVPFNTQPGSIHRINNKLITPIRLTAQVPTLIPTGIAVRYEREDGKKYGLEVEDRSSMAVRGIFVSAGKIDAGYTGELRIILTLTQGAYADIWPGDKIAQILPREIMTDTVEVVKDLSETSRGEKGFGASGR